MPRTTISVIKADVGSFPGHSRTHPKLLETAAKMLKAERGKLLVDSFVTHCGDDLELIMTHTRGVDSEAIHRLAWNVFLECTGVAKNLKLYGAGQDMPADAFAGNVRGMGPGVAEMEFEERESDPVLVFMAGKTGPAHGTSSCTRSSPIRSTPRALSPTRLFQRALSLRSTTLSENERSALPARRKATACLLISGRHPVT